MFDRKKARSLMKNTHTKVYTHAIISFPRSSLAVNHHNIINNARAPLYRLVNVCAFLNKPRLISLTLQIGSNFDLCIN